MNSPRLLCYSLFFLITSSLSANSMTIEELFRNSYRVYEGQRNELGAYRDSTVFAGENYHPASCANVGIGLISLCIADHMNWHPLDDAREMSLRTLEAMASEGGSFQVDRNPAGAMRHFFNLSTGAQSWSSEYSTIDTAIFMCGALFAKTYFQDEEITRQVDAQFRQIDWSKMIADPVAGTIYRELDSQGNGIPDRVSPPFNEYMVVAYLAYKAEGDRGGPATQLWKAHYQDASNLTKKSYAGLEQLTDTPGAFVSNFIPQFCYFLCHEFTGKPSYRTYLDNAMNADRVWFSLEMNSPDFIWGLGAGESLTQGYRANHLGDNDDAMVSPQIVGGFAVIDPARCVQDLLTTYEDGRGIYEIDGHEVLWRYSLDDSSWIANSIHGIDYSSMLFGLASLEQHCGPDFFRIHNDFDFPANESPVALGEGEIANVF